MKVPEPKKLPSGNYRVRIMIDGKSVSITCPTAAECRKEAMLIKAGAKELCNPESRTLRIACDKYIEDRSQVLSPSTIRGYREIQRNRYQSVMDIPLKSNINWQQLVNDEAKRVSAKTVKNTWTFIKSVLANEGLKSPDIRLPQIERKDMPYLTYEQMMVLIKAVEDTEIELPVLLALNGLRRSEIFAMTKKNIDCDKKIIKVRGARIEGDDGYILKKTNKNDSSSRDVPILFDRLLVIAPKSPDTDIIVNISEKHLSDRINRVCGECGLPLVGTHGCRRSFASWCSHERIPEDICMKWGGWSDIYTMRKIYQKTYQEDMDSYAEALRKKSSH